VIRVLNKYEPYWEHIKLVLACILFLFLIWTNVFNFFLSSLNETQKILFSSLLSAIIAIILLYFGYKANIRLEYFRDVKALIQEMTENNNKIQDFPTKFREAYGKCDEITINRWIEKSPSYTNWGDGNNFHLKFLPTQAYFNFINKGHINQTEYFSFPAESVASFYQFCIEFSKYTQILENAIRKMNKNPNEQIEFTSLRFPKITFHSSQEICSFLLETVYPYYSQRNDLNYGIILEYKKTIESIKKHEWLLRTEKDVNVMKNGWLYLKIIIIVVFMGWGFIQLISWNNTYNTVISPNLMNETAFNELSPFQQQMWISTKGSAEAIMGISIAYIFFGFALLFSIIDSIYLDTKLEKLLEKNDSNNRIEGEDT